MQRGREGGAKSKTIFPGFRLNFTARRTPAPSPHQWASAPALEAEFAKIGAREEGVRYWVSEGSVPAFNFDLCDVARETAVLRRPDLLDALLALEAGVQGARLHTKTAWLAIAAEAAGRQDEALALFQHAEQGWRESGDPYERAHSLLGQARCLIGLERANEAVQPLTEACDLFAQLGAAPAHAETDTLLQYATALGV